MPKASSPDKHSDFRPKVCMFVYNNFTNDSRVQKEAEALIQENYDVTVMALLDNNSVPYQEYDSVVVHQI